MAAPPPSVQLRQEDFPDGLKDTDAVGNLLLPIVGFSKAVASAMTGGLSVKQNLATQVVPISFTTPATDWITIPTANFAGTWATGSTPLRYRIDSTGLVHIGGFATNPGATSPVVTIASGFPIPDAAMNFPVTINGTIVGSVQVTTAGLLVYQTSASLGIVINTLTLDSIRYTPVNYAPAVLSCFPFNAYTSISNPSLVTLTNLVGPTVTAPTLTSSTTPPQMGYGTLKYHTRNRDGIGSGSVLVIDNIPGCALNTRYTGNLLVFQ